MIAAIDGNIMAGFIFGLFVIFIGVVVCLEMFLTYRQNMKKLELQMIKETNKEKEEAGEDKREKQMSEWDRKHFDGSHESW